jgi:hypothetical protein
VNAHGKKLLAFLLTYLCIFSKDLWNSSGIFMNYAIAATLPFLQFYLYGKVQEYY